LVVLVVGKVEQSSTAAARSYVLVTRDRLRVEIERDGARARQRRSFQRLEHSISPQELAHMWPHADLQLALAD
jgi:hypothetical protein